MRLTETCINKVRKKLDDVHGNYERARGEREIWTSKEGRDKVKQVLKQREREIKTEQYEKRKINQEQEIQKNRETGTEKHNL